MADFSDTIVIVEGVDTDVIGTSDPNLQAGAVKESGQVGFFIVSEIPYSIYFKNSVGLWSGTPAVAFTSGTLQKTFAFEWGTNTAFYIKTATSGHKMFAKPSSSNIVVDSDLTDGDFTRTKIVIGNQVSTILGDVTGGTVGVLESADESLQTRFSTSTAELGSSVDSLETAVSGEASSRGTAVSSLETRIGAEETATSSINSSVDSLEAAISAEAGTRATADANISAQTSTTGVAVGSLQTRISTEETARASADTALQASVDSLETAISAEATTHSDDTSSLETAISGEATTRASADTALQASVDSIETKLATIQDAGATLDTFQELVSFVESLDDVDGVEIVNLGLSVDSLETAVSGESSSRSTAVSSLNTRIAADEGDMTAVEASVDSLETAISGEASSRGAADTALQASVDSLETAVSGEASSRGAADTALQASVDSLETAVTGEASTRSTAVSSLNTRIAADEGDMTAVEASIDSLEAFDTALATSLTTTAVTISGSSDTPFAIYNAGDTSPLFMVDASSSWDGAPRITIRQANDHDQTDTAFPATSNTDLAVRGVFHVEREMSENDYDSSTEENMPLISAFAMGDGTNGGSAADGADAIVRLVAWGGDSKIQMYAAADTYDATSIGGKRPLSGQVLGAIEMGGYATNQGPIPAAWMRVVAAETWSYTNTNGTIFQFRSTREGSGNGYAQGGIDHIAQMSHNRGFNVIAPPVAYADTSNMLVLNSNQTNDGWASYMIASDGGNSRMVMYVKDSSGTVQTMNLPYSIGEDVSDNSTAISQLGSDLQTLSGSVSTNASSISSNSTTIASNESIIEDIRDAVNAASNGDDLLTRLQAISWPT